MSETNWWLVEPVIPSEMRGSGFHEEDIGPLHDRPYTKEKQAFVDSLPGIVKEIGVIYWDTVLSSLRMESPTARMFHL